MHIRKLFKILGVFGFLLMLTAYKERQVEENDKGIVGASSGNISGEKQNKNATSFQSANKPVFENIESDEYDFSDDIPDEVPPTAEKLDFDKNYEALISDLKKASKTERVLILHKKVDELEKQKEKYSNLKFSEEIDIDFMIKPLKNLPKSDSFDLKDCKSYKDKMYTYFEPTVDEESKDPALSKAVEVLNTICSEKI